MTLTLTLLHRGPRMMADCIITTNTKASDRQLVVFLNNEHGGTYFIGYENEWRIILADILADSFYSTLIILAILFKALFTVSVDSVIVGALDA